MATELLQPVVADGVRLTHFFNGRVLTAEDLRREQDALRDRHRGLAGAVGEGVVRGLEVSRGKHTLPDPSVHVTAGLAFNRDGDPVALPRPVELRLIPAAAERVVEGGRFALCRPPEDVVSITNPGFYLLAARPASAHSRERVSAVDLDSGVGTRCGSRFEEMGASFRLVPLPLDVAGGDGALAATLGALALKVTTAVNASLGKREGSGVEGDLLRDLSRLRNGMAYWCAGLGMGAARIASLAVPAAPAPVPPLTPVEALRASGELASCEVPLALLLVTRDRLEWADMWSVRRVPEPSGDETVFGQATGALPRAESAALFLQFRDQASSFFRGAPLPAAHSVDARDWFLFLPSAGILPLRRLDSTGREVAAGFEPSTFFGWLEGRGTVQEVPASWASALVEKALHDTPSSLAESPELRFYAFGAGAGSFLMFRTRRWLPRGSRQTEGPSQLAEVSRVDSGAKTGSFGRVLR